jgi:hypothetical protein
MAKQRISRAGRSQGCLNRGIDPIPENWELASSYRAQRSLSRSSTVLERLIAKAVDAGDKTLARDLRSISTAVLRGLLHLSGGFPIKEIEAEVRKWGKAGSNARRWQEAQHSRRPPLQLVVDNTRGRS